MTLKGRSALGLVVLAFGLGYVVHGVSTTDSDSSHVVIATQRDPIESPTPSASATPTRAPASTPVPAPTGEAAAALELVPVKGPAPMTGYDRDSFHFKSDVDRNGCDTRNDILRRDLTGVLFKAGTGGCLVESGTLADPYSGQTIAMRREPGDPVDIDHVVALGNAWVTGAFRWSEEQRTALANDPLNLLAVDGSANRQKGDSDSASWLPRRAYQCAYVARQIAVKRAYGLWLKPAEKAMDAQVLRRCPGERLPTEASSMPPRRDPSAPTGSQAAPTPAAQSAGATYYANCDAVRVAGKAPLYKGQPGYETPRLDRDGDGVACSS